MAKTRIFLSWSGDGSRQAADAWNRLLPQILQQVDTFYSPKIDKGAEWWAAIRTALRGSNGLGIFFLTRHNLTAPWLLFEAGFVGGAVGGEPEETRLWLLEVEPKIDLSFPLVAYQRTQTTEEEIFSLIRSINSMTEQPLDLEILKSVFKRAWPELREAMEEARNAIPPNDKSASPKLDESAMSSGMLASLQRIENAIANLTPRPSPLALASALRSWQAGQIPLGEHDKLDKAYDEALSALARGQTSADRPVSLKDLFASISKSEASSSDPNIAKKAQ